MRDEFTRLRTPKTVSLLAEVAVHKLTQEQWQFLWLKAEEATALNRLSIRDWLFEQITEAGFDVRDDVVIALELPPQQS
jgi:hypothetical protein